MVFDSAKGRQMKTPKHRKTLKRRIAAEPSQWNKQALAQAGREVSMNWWRVKLWHERWQKTKLPNGTMPLAEFEREALLSLFMRPLVELDDKFFSDMADEIRSYKAHPMPDQGTDPTCYKLSDPWRWAARPPLTVQAIKQRIGFAGTTRRLLKLLTEMDVPFTKSKGGRPRKPGTDKP